jgi:hypothetical protein
VSNTATLHITQGFGGGAVSDVHMFDAGVVGVSWTGGHLSKTTRAGAGESVNDVHCRMLRNALDQLIGKPIP